MVAKEELSKKLNALLGLDATPIDFEKMSKEDLERLLTVFTNLAQIAQVGMRSMKGKLQEGILLRPAKDVLNMRVIDVVGSIRREGGLLGILDAVLQERRKTVGAKE